MIVLLSYDPCTRLQAAALPAIASISNTHSARKVELHTKRGRRRLCVSRMLKQCATARRHYMRTGECNPQMQPTSSKANLA
jgi:hypothetical protein